YRDLTEDAPRAEPFDLISCRNVLVYLKPESRTRVLRQFHQILKPGGYLLLGESERLQGSLKEWFSPVDGQHALYRRVESRNGGA
ncbi:MAG TPA: CheR family methyltransferase, partial [Planctomycetota bacterium]|nr:CheR family methyltransferase [Planctomycetota bacterium]